MPGRYLYICNRAIYGYTVNSRTGPNVTSVSDTVVNKAITYGYDEFDRLTSLTVNSGQVQNYTYGYDRYGNRVAQNALQGGTNFSTTVNAATNQLVGYTYDAAGNMTNDGFHAYSYDAEGNILTVDGGATATYVYDALNHRVWSNNAGSTYEYTYDAGGHRVSSWVEPSNQGNEGRIYWDGQQIAYRSSDGTTYFDHQDYLGTERMRTNSAGALAATFSTLPWGDGYVANIVDAAAGQDSLQFAGLDADVNSSGAPMSDHAQFRNYSFQQGRWLAPDPYDGSYDITNPQSLNRYAYALNNPLSFIDRLGLDPCPGAGGGGGGADPGDGGDGDDPNDPEIARSRVRPDDTGCDCGPNCVGVVADPPTPLPDPCDTYDCFAGPGGGGGTGTAPNNATPWYKTCTAQALGKGLGGAALDAIGIIPEGGTISAAFSLFHGAAGISNGTKILGRVAFGAGLISTASAGSDLSEANGVNASSTVAGLQVAAGGFGVAKGLIEDIPVAGQVIAAGATTLDLISTGLEVAKCY